MMAQQVESTEAEQFEKLVTKIGEDADKICELLANEVAELIREKNRAWLMHEIDMAVPLSPDELNNKIQAVYKHQTQRSQTVSRKESKDPWMQVKKVNSSTADEYDQLGLAEYEALETFKRWRK